MKKLLYILALLPCVAFAHGGKTTTNIDYTTNVYSSEMADGVALAMAMAAPQYDLNVESIQLGVGGAYYEDRNSNGTSGAAIGLGKRFCTKSSCGVMNFSVGINEGGGMGVNFGFTWKL